MIVYYALLAAIALVILLVWGPLGLGVAVAVVGALGFVLMIKDAVDKHLAEKERIRREPERLAAEENRLKRQREKEIEDNRRATEQALLSLQTQARSIVVQARDEASNLVSATQRAVEATKSVERELADGQIGGFWDAVETTAAELHQCRRILDEIKGLALKHQRVGGSLQPGQLPEFDLGLERFPDVLEVEHRLTQLRRRADRIEAFANAWGMRRIEKTLVAGFESLGQALSKLETELKTSLSDLEMTLQSALAASAAASAVQTDRIVSEIRAIREQHAAESPAQRAAGSTP